MMYIDQSIAQNAVKKYLDENGLSELEAIVLIVNYHNNLLREFCDFVGQPVTADILLDLKNDEDQDVRRGYKIEQSITDIFFKLLKDKKDE